MRLPELNNRGERFCNRSPFVVIVVLSWFAALKKLFPYNLRSHTLTSALGIKALRSAKSDTPIAQFVPSMASPPAPGSGGRCNNCTIQITCVACFYIRSHLDRLVKKQVETPYECYLGFFSKSFQHSMREKATFSPLLCRGNYENLGTAIIYSL